MVQVFKHMCVQHLSSVCAVKSLYKGILRGLSRLHVLDLDVVFVAPVFEFFADEFGPIVSTDGFGQGVGVAQHLQHAQGGQ
jgi:hypothetical protein